jgi:hypothetical protein
MKTIHESILRKMKQDYNASNKLNEKPTWFYGISLYKDNYRNYLEWLSLPWGGDCMKDDYNESTRYAAYLIEERSRRYRLKKSVERSMQEYLDNRRKGIVPKKKYYTKKDSPHTKNPVKVTKLW